MNRNGQQTNFRKESFQCPNKSNKKNQICSNRHHLHCPIPADHRKHTKIQQRQAAHSKQRIKYFKNPILKQLRLLLINQINSAERLTTYLDKMQHQNALHLFKNDCQILIEYMNSIRIKQIPVENFQIDFQTKLQKKIKQKQKVKKYSQQKTKRKGQDNVLEQLDFMMKQQKKTRSTSQQITNKNIKDQLKSLKIRVTSLEKSIKIQPQNSHNQDLKQKIKTEQNNLIELLTNDQNQNKINGKDNLEFNFNKVHEILDQFSTILQKTIKESDKTFSFYLFSKQKVDMILNKLKNGMIQSEAQASSKKSVDIIEQLCLQIKRLQNEQIDDQKAYEQLKINRNNLNQQLAEMLIECEKREQIIEYLKRENTRLQKQYQQIENRNAQIHQNLSKIGQFIRDLQLKNKHLNNQMRLRLNIINELQQENNVKQEELNLLKNKIFLLEQNVIDLKISLEQKTSKQKLALQQIRILQQKNDDILNFEQLRKIQYLNLQNHINELQNQNRTLYSDLRNLKQLLAKSDSQEMIQNYLRYNQSDKSDNKDVYLQLNQMKKKIEQQNDHVLMKIKQESQNSQQRDKQQEFKQILKHLSKEHIQDHNNPFEEKHNSQVYEIQCYSDKLQKLKNDIEDYKRSLEEKELDHNLKLQQKTKQIEGLRKMVKRCLNCSNCLEMLQKQSISILQRSVQNSQITNKSHKSHLSQDNSIYQINIINENQMTTKTEQKGRKNNYLKQNQNNKLRFYLSESFRQNQSPYTQNKDIFQEIQKAISSISNIANAEISDSGEESLPLQIKIQNNLQASPLNYDDEEFDKVSQISKNVNFDEQQSDERQLNMVDERNQQDKNIRNSKGLNPQIILSSTQEKYYISSPNQDINFLKNVNIEAQKQADLRLSGQNQIEQRKPRKNIKKKQPSVYIKLYRGNDYLQPLTQTKRSKSLYQSKD